MYMKFEVWTTTAPIQEWLSASKVDQYLYDNLVELLGLIEVAVQP